MSTYISQSSTDVFGFTCESSHGYNILH